MTVEVGESRGASINRRVLLSEASELDRSPSAVAGAEAVGP